MAAHSESDGLAGITPAMTNNMDAPDINIQQHSQPSSSAHLALDSSFEESQAPTTTTPSQSHPSSTAQVPPRPLSLPSVADGTLQNGPLLSPDDMSVAATLQMQDLDVYDGDNHSSIFMMPGKAIRGIDGRVPLAKARPSTPQQQQQPVHQDPCADLEAKNIDVTKYCYRHRADPRTGRQADEFSMEHVQDLSERELKHLAPAARDGVQSVWSLFAAAPAKQRELMLRGILAGCCFPQLSYIAASVRDLLKIDFLGALPPELGLRVLCFLDATSLCAAAQVSRTWRNLADDDIVWHRMCEQHIDRKCTTCGWGLPLLDKKRLDAERALLNQRLRTRPTSSPSSKVTHSEIHTYPDSASDDGEPGSNSQKPGGTRKRTAAAIMPEQLITIKKSCTPTYSYAGAESYFQQTSTPQKAWKDVYRDRFLIGRNWRHGRCETKVVTGHTSEVTCLQIDDEIIVTGSYDTTIKIWDVETGNELRTLTGHTMGVKCLQFDKAKLVSGSLDGTLKMWDLKKGKVIRTFPGHSGAVVSVHFDGSILASGSQDRTIRVRDFANMSRVSLRGHTDYVNSVRVDAASQTLFSASDDCTVRIWDLEAKRCLRILRGHNLQVTQVLPMPPGFDVGDVDPMDQDSSPSSPDGALLPLPAARATGRAPPEYLLTCSMDSTIRLWQVSTGKCLRTFFGHLEGIWTLAADSLRVISGANDGIVKMWDPRTGRAERTLADHRGPVTTLGLSDRLLVTASEDRSIRIYDFSAADGVKRGSKHEPAAAAAQVGQAGQAGHAAAGDMED